MNVSDHQPAGAAAAGLPPGGRAGTWTTAILALMLFLAPALGMPHNQVIQETLKSSIVSVMVPAAALAFFWLSRHDGARLAWHPVTALPLLLAAYALGSAALGGGYFPMVEAVRWLLVALLVWVGASTFSRERLPWLALGIHAGATIAALWTALQFWFNFGLFAQGPNPASTFGNRNFYAEFAVTAMPFGALLLGQARRTPHIAALAASWALVILSVMMTGTRSALIALLLQALLVLPLAAWALRHRLAWPSWSTGQRVLAAALIVGAIGALGMLPSQNNNILEEGRGATPSERALRRLASLGDEGLSINLRVVMWKDTLRMMQANPWTGVGPGYWQREVPLYRSAGEQAEIDAYAHNEYLQLLAEYGLAGWLFLGGLLAWLARAAWLTRRGALPDDDLPWRATALASLMGLLLVSGTGFAWHLATTLALLAVNLAILAGSQPRPAAGPRIAPAASMALAGLMAACVAGTAWFAERAMAGESRIMKAANLAAGINATRDNKDPALDGYKREVLRLIREGIEINPRYRRTTPVVGDEFARWGDWKNATWIWESVTISHPYVVVILTNVARGYARANDVAKASEFLERARKVQPTAPTVRALDVIIPAQAGQDQKALAAARAAMDAGVSDYDMFTSAYQAGVRAGDTATALRALTLRLKAWPNERAAEGHVQLGNLLAQGRPDSAEARQAFEQGLRLAAPAQREALLAQVPPAYRTTAAK